MGALSKLNNILNRSKEGEADETKATFYTTPVAYRDEDGVWVGHNGELWMYRVIDSNPISWEDPATKLGVEKPLADILYELASTSRDTGGLKSLSKAREVHLIALTWETDAQVPKGTPDDLAQFMKRLLYFTVPNRAVVVGVKLWSGLAKDKTLLEQARDRVTGALGEAGPDWESYEQDRRVVAEILGRNGGVVPPRRVREQMESWYNYGRGTDVAAWETEDYVRVGAERIEMASVMRFDSPILYAPHNQWGLSAQTHPAPVCVASVRGILEPSGVSRNRVRKSQRRVLNEIEEEQASGDIERPEQSMVLQLAQEVEQFILSNREPLVSNCSIVLGRRVQPNVDETYADELRTVYGIETQPLVHRQMAALEETLPTSSRRVNPFVQDLSIGMLAYAGFQGFSNLGDGKGVWVGLTDPDYVPCFLDPLGAPRANRPPGLLIAGDPGSGKAMPLTHPVLTPKGFVPMGDITLGSEVIGRDGVAHKVVGVYPQGEKEIFRVWFSDGSFADCCDEHLWSVRRSMDAARGKGWRTMSLGEIREAGLRDRDGKARFRIPMVDPVQFEERELPLDPYVTGALIGDGSLTTFVGISSADPEILEEVGRLLPDTCELVHRSAYDWTVVRKDRGRAAAGHVLASWDAKNALPPRATESLASLREFIAGAATAVSKHEDGEVLVPFRSVTLCEESARALAEFGVVARVEMRPRQNWSRLVWQRSERCVPVLVVDEDLLRDCGEPQSAGSSFEGGVEPFLAGVLAQAARLSTTGTTVLLKGDARLGEIVAARMNGHQVRYGATGAMTIAVAEAGNPVLDTVRKLGLSGKTSLEKFIPEQYRRASVQQRVALLQGLMDTDGECGKRGLVFNTSSEQLMRDVTELVQLLGGVARCTDRTPMYWHNDELRHGETAYRLAIRLPETVVPFRLQRKLEMYQSVKRAVPCRTIVKVEALPKQAAQCISVDAPDHLYVAGQAVVTHNTFLASLLAIQSSLAGHQTIFVNPKPADSLAPMARFAGGRVVKLTEIEEQGGFFDPFRFTAQTAEGRQVAADIASQHILAVLGSRGVAGLGFSQEQEIALIAGLREGAARGAQCVAQAMQFVPDQSVQQLVYQQAADPLFRLGISFQPVEPYSADDGLLLIEFDRPLDVPEKGVSPAEYTRTQRLAVAAVRLVTRSSLEILASRKGGVLVVDEAWMFLQSTEGLAALQSIGRMGRSQNILPIFATQRVDDLLREGVDMEGYLSRVFALQLADEREARAALRLCRLEPTEGRINWLRQAGPRRGEGGRPGRAAMGLHRDLQGRHAAVMFGPVPEDVRLAISTNPEDRRVRDESGETR
jgi:hypothetical protein